MTGIDLPEGLELRRTTDTWDAASVPKGLLRAHRIADGVWGRLVCVTGRVDLVFEDDGTLISLEPGEHSPIPPARPHHVELDDAASFHVEFYV